MPRNGLSTDGMPEATGWLIERDDHLIGTDHTEILSGQLVSEVRIRMPRIEKIRAVLEFRLLLLELRELGFPLLECAMIAAPRENSVRPRDRMSGEGADDD